jgi:hypothetical protein
MISAPCFAVARERRNFVRANDQKELCQRRAPSAIGERGRKPQAVVARGPKLSVRERF